MGAKVSHRIYDGSPDGPQNADGTPVPATGEHTVLWWCQGCRCLHAVRLAVAKERPDAPVWQYNGNDDAPTFTPSVLTTSGGYGDWPKRVCHVFVRDGKIEYLSDCTHDHAGKSGVEMRDWADVMSGAVDEHDPSGES